MNPRFAASSAYFPFASRLNSNFPSSAVIMDCTFFESLVSPIVTRARDNGCPSVLLTSTPAMRNSETAGFSGAAVCANARALASATALAKRRIRIVPLWRMVTLRSNIQRHLRTHLLASIDVHNRPLPVVRFHRLGIAIGNLLLLRRERQHPLIARRHRKRSERSVR